MVRSCLQQSDRKMMDFTLGEVRLEFRKTAALDFWRVDFELFRMSVRRIPCESVLKGKMVQDGWTLLKKKILSTGTGTGHVPSGWEKVCGHSIP